MSDHYFTDLEIEYIVNNKTLEWIRQQHYDEINRKRIIDKIGELLTGHKLNEYDETILDRNK